MAANRLTRGSASGRAREAHGGTFEREHEKFAGRKKGTPNAMSRPLKDAIIEAGERVGADCPIEDPSYWQWVIANSSMAGGLTRQEIENPGSISQVLRRNAKAFEDEAFARTFGTAMAARIEHHAQIAYENLLYCLMYLAAHRVAEYAKYTCALIPPTQKFYYPDQLLTPPRGPPPYQGPKQHKAPSYPTPKQATPSAPPFKPIPQWWLGNNGRTFTPLPFDSNLTADEAYHEICGSPVYRGLGWDWIFDSSTNRYWALELRPKTPIPDWTVRNDMTPVPVNAETPEPYHRDFGSPLHPERNWQWNYNYKIKRLVPCISVWPAKQFGRPSFETPKPRDLLVRWHPDEGRFSLVHDDDDVGGYKLLEYDPDLKLFVERRIDIDRIPATKRLR